MKLDVVFGTRPEAIKLCPFVIKSKQMGHQVRVIFTAQHREMVEPILKLFKVKPDIDLNIMKPGQSLNDISLGVMAGLIQAWKVDKPDYVVVQGDTTTCMSAGLAAFQEGLQVLHVEAGLRTNDLKSPWPEEFNRRVTALCAAVHAAPTKEAAENVLKEGHPGSRVCVTGNTGIDALMMAVSSLRQSAELRKPIEEKFKFLGSKPLILATLHRRESFGQPMEQVFRALKEIALENSVDVLLPLHLNPRVRQSARKIFDLPEMLDLKQPQQSSGVWFCEPVGYDEMVFLIEKSRFLISDSGGLQEEAPTLGRPILVTRESTERPEAVQAGGALLVGTDIERIKGSAKMLLSDSVEFHHMSQPRFPYGDGKAVERIFDFLAKL
jgi:UDP-N-acetylglucosamine 2-epimerase (non-hydrolysing)